MELYNYINRIWRIVEIFFFFTVYFFNTVWTFNRLFSPLLSCFGTRLWSLLWGVEERKNFFLIFCIKNIFKVKSELFISTYSTEFSIFYSSLSHSCIHTYCITQRLLNILWILITIKNSDNNLISYRLTHQIEWNIVGKILQANLDLYARLVCVRN